MLSSEERAELERERHKLRVQLALNGDARDNDDLPIMSSADFVRGFRPPDYLVDGILQRGFVYSNTGATGAGKTAIALRLLAHVGLGRPIGGCDVQQGRCLMLVGENPDDVRARWIALSEQVGFDAANIDVHFLPRVLKIPDALGLIQAKVAALGGLSFLNVDTSAAYFPGEEENSNKEIGDHARVLRSLTELPGKPCVLVNCHPVKNATGENLIPRGGGAFIAEMDGNLCCSKQDRTVELHWQGKFRGPDFEPIPFELVTVTSSRLVDTRGRYVPTVIARMMTQTEQATREGATKNELLNVLAIMNEHPGASLAEIAGHCGWTLQGGVPYKSKVQRHLATLKRQKLVTNELGAWTLTKAGEKAIQKCAK